MVKKAQKAKTKPEAEDPAEAEANAFRLIEEAPVLASSHKSAPAAAAPVSQPTVSSVPMTKSDAMRKAIAAGITKPSEAVEWVQKEFGLEITAGTFSTFKTTEAKKGQPNPKEKKQLVPVSTGNPIEVALAVKELVRLYGADAVKQWVEVVS